TGPRRHSVDSFEECSGRRGRRGRFHEVDYPKMAHAPQRGQSGIRDAGSPEDPFAPPDRKGGPMLLLVGARGAATGGRRGDTAGFPPSSTRALMKLSPTSAMLLMLVVVRAAAADGLADLVPLYKPVDIVMLLQDDKAKKALNIVSYQEAGIKA